jgi:ribosomal protein L21E
MQYQVHSKSYRVGEKVEIVPWMARCYPEFAGKVATVQDVSGATAEICTNKKRQIVDLTHLQPASIH